MIFGEELNTGDVGQITYIMILNWTSGNRATVKAETTQLDIIGMLIKYHYNRYADKVSL